MNIVFYSTNSNFFDNKNTIFTTIPSFKEQWQTFTKNHPEHTFFVVTQLPGMFLPVELANIPNSNVYIQDTTNTAELTSFIKSLCPDLAIATSFWTVPFDWLPIKDALVAQSLRQAGIKTICHSVKTSSICFDKWETQHFFKSKGFNYAKGVFVKHDLFFCAGNQKDVKENVYKESVLSQIKEMNFPLIIKDNVGLSSYGMTVAHTFGEVTNYLNSKKNNSDRIVEEYIDGEQFGAEIYGTPGNYSILPPFKFSLNQYGITSPKLSQKTGPFYEHFEELKKELTKLAELLEFFGVAQVDLIYSNEKWYIIEINPRLSGMTMTYAASTSLSVYEMLYKTCVLHEQLPEPKLPTINKKHELSNAKELVEISKNPNVKYIIQIENKAAKQEREKGYCEIISSGSSLQNNFLP